MKSAIHILAVGARTPLGTNAAASAAAVRAGVSALEQHPFLVDQVGDMMPAAIDAELDPRIVGAPRMVALAHAALADACATLGGAALELARLPVYVGLPEYRPGFGERDAVAVRAGLAGAEIGPVQAGDVTVFPRGHSSGIYALAAAVKKMRQGAMDVCLVGGVDSYFHPDTMEWLDANRQLAGSVSRSGFVPGEGAAFCLLVHDSPSGRGRLKPMARVRAVTVGKETKLIKTSEMCLGEGLTATVREAVSGLCTPVERINHVICDVNGERYRSEEWGFTCLRLAEYFDDPAAYQSPADFWGDVGAASAPLYAMLVCHTPARKTRKPRSLLWTSSEHGERGVAVLETAEQKA